MTITITIAEHSNGRIRDKFSLKLKANNNGKPLLKETPITHDQLKQHGYNGNDATPLSKAMALFFELQNKLSDSNFTDEETNSFIAAWVFDHHELSALIRLINTHMQTTGDFDTSTELTITSRNQTLTLNKASWTHCVNQANKRIALKQPKMIFNTAEQLLSSWKPTTPQKNMTPILSLSLSEDREDGWGVANAHDITLYPEGDPIRKSQYYQRSSTTHNKDDAEEYGLEEHSKRGTSIKSGYDELMRILSSNTNTNEKGQQIHASLTAAALLLMIDGHARSVVGNFDANMDGITLLIDRKPPITIKHTDWEHYLEQATHHGNRAKCSPGIGYFLVK